MKRLGYPFIRGNEAFFIGPENKNQCWQHPSQHKIWHYLLGGQAWNRINPFNLEELA